MGLSITQQKYPLSSRKFWKKIVTRGVTTGILFLVLGLSFTIFLVAAGSETKSTGYLMLSILAGSLMWLSLFCLLYLLPYGAFLHVYIQRYYYSLDDNFITIRKNVFTPTEIHVQYQKIQDVYVDQDIFDRIFGIYDVHISSATISSGITAHIDGLRFEHAEALKNEILEKIQHPGTVNTGSASTGVVSQPDRQIIKNLTQGISTANFPINSRWLISTALTTVWTIAAGSIFFGGFFLLSFATEEGVSNSYSSYVFLIYAVINLVAGISRFIYALWWRKNYFFEFQEEYIVLKQGVISREERHIQYSSIQNVTLKQRITDRIFGICDVVIENAAIGGSGIAMSVGQNAGRGIIGSSGVIIPGQLLDDGKKLVEIVNGITVQKIVTPNMKGL